jgi:hypothetical protein
MLTNWYQRGTKPSPYFPTQSVLLLFLAQEAELPLKVVQTAAVLEVLHSAVGLVRSPVAITGEDVCIVLHLCMCAVCVFHIPFCR